MLKYLWLELKNLHLAIFRSSTVSYTFRLCILQVQDCREMNKAEKSISVVLFIIHERLYPEADNPIESHAIPRTPMTHLGHGVLLETKTLVELIRIYII